MTLEKRALLALGGNLPWRGNGPNQTILMALRHLSAQLQGNMAVSRLYRTPAFPAGSGPDYVNAAATVTLRHNISAQEILAALHETEAVFGRERLQRWGMRTLDIDLIALDDQIWPDLAGWQQWHELPPADQTRLTPTGLILPHPRVQDRAFVLVPLADVAPDWRHPVLGLTVRQMCAALPLAARAEVVALDSAGLS